MKRSIIVAFSLSSLVFLGAGCYGTTNPKPIAPPAVNQPPANLPAPVPVGTTPPPAPAPLKAAVSISGFSFSPAALAVKKGTTVVWTNSDPVGHTVTADNGSGPASGLLNTGDSYSFTFNSPGTFAYHCSIHKTMQGTITVTE